MADTHDPLCPVTVYGVLDMAGRACRCDFIAHVRDQIAAEIEADRDALADEAPVRDIRIGMSRAIRIVRGGFNV